ncbi:MAG: 50S ribosomal protein L9 [Clostridia bacterium]|nr:50S ribosomal protein L9 [Clostridia bacterium]
MKVILLENIKGVGKKDEVINASDGYARNYLLPRKLAAEANSENMSKLKAKQDSKAYQKGQEKQQAENLAEKLKGILLKIAVKSGENGKIFGSITAKEIADQLKEQYQIEVDKKKIDLKEPIKTLGSFSVSIKLFEGVIGTLKVQMISQ